MIGLSRRQLVLLLIGVDNQGRLGDHINGITRLQKLLYLMEQEERIMPSGAGFDFEPYDAGPYSSALYDDLEVLENLGLIASDVNAEAVEEEEPELERLSFDQLMGDQEDKAADAYEERKFYLTEEGRRRIEAILKAGENAPIIDSIRRIKSQYGYYSLRDLLYFVYTRYPEMTTESKIRDQVLKRRSKK
jgi:uncharacterized protein YwgA